MMKFDSYLHFTQYLDRLGLFHMDLTLDRVAGFAHEFGEVGFDLVQVVGTNGKGSVCAYLDELFLAHDYGTGRYCSPHFLDVRERILLNRKMASKSEWLDAANQVAETAPDAGLTYFEFITCLGVVLYQGRKTDVAIMEAGLGGTYDAVNVFSPDVTVFTPIDLDHEKVLGRTVAEIARDKAGAMKPGSVAVTGTQRPEAMAELRARADKVGARLVHADRYLDEKGFSGLAEGLAPSMLGEHQKQNAVLALAAFIFMLERKGRKPSPDLCLAAVRKAFVPGRIQFEPDLDPPMILDGAHNEHSLLALRKAVEDNDINVGAVIFCCMRDKNIRRMAPVVRAISNNIIIPPMQGYGREFAPAELAEIMGHGARTTDSINHALDMARGAGWVLICGSLYLLAEFYKYFPETLNRPGAICE